MKVKVDVVNTPEFEMDYFCFGEGKQPFVIIPGLSLLPVTPLAGAVANQYRSFSKDYRVYLFDRIRQVPDDYTIEQMAAHTACAMRKAGISNACLMGCSQGGMIAQVIAATEPDLVSKLVLCSSASHACETAAKVLGNWVSLAQAGDIVAFNRDVFKHVYSQAYYDKNEQAFVYAEKLGTPDDIAHFIPLARACEGFDSRPILGNIKCPVLVVGSNIDNVLTGEGSRELASLLKCDIIMYDEYGHAAYDEAPDLHDHLHKFFEA